MAQQGLGLSAPTSRQDVISALLNDYGNSFKSPVPTLKDLPPPPPPRGDSLKNKPLPAVQRMSMKFQLRVDEDIPLSPDSPRKDSVEQRPRKRIVSRSLSRDSKPPSLRLTTSNGSTATIPPTPALPPPTRSLGSSELIDEKDLPPPPPEKSIRRKSVKQPAMGTQQSRSARELARNDSLLSQGEPKVSANVSSGPGEVSPIVKRKAVPMPQVKRFKSLAELGQGPRGGRGGPMPPTSAPRKASVDSQATAVSDTDASQSTDTTIRPQQEGHSNEAPALNQLPPTPDEDDVSAAPAPPRKAFTAIGLPSNPRAKGPASPLHMRGKSSTGFNILKAHRPAPPIPSMEVGTITPEMTPSPTLKPIEARTDMEISPVSPLPSPSGQRRPFSYEAPSEPQKNAVQQPVRPTTATAAAAPPAPKSLAQLVRPLRTTSLDPPESSPEYRPSTAPAQEAPQLLNSPPPSVPASPIAKASTPPPFTPLTRQPIPLPVTLIPQITSSQVYCYTSHRTNIWSNNTFQPMGCMVCHSNDNDRKWACTWCQLRICRACSEELNMVPGRDLGKLLEAKKELEGVGGGNPGIVVSSADLDEQVDEYEDRFR
ncbi:hypothetical protein BKA66DRAFT_564419 [Pyrenochaeta sp. MPI-SDFR-AT-0127]|nr:hypothetical protein BKA66DRAFT_564419 [Pyrenochaeta sp. MPI-SDFR-AT-0127]